MPSDQLSRRALIGILGIIFLIGLAIGLGTFSLSLTGGEPAPIIQEGDFTTAPPGSGSLAFTGQTCSSDSDCPQTTCSGKTYYVDTDGSGECQFNEKDGKYECGGYDKAYADADICGGRYDYACDSSGCDGYKAACEADCSANMGCDTYDFCADDDDDDDSSGSSGSSDTGSDACEQHVTKCDGDTVVQCQDTDGDGYTDGFEAIESCDGTCENAVCVPPQVTRWYPGETGTDCVASEVDEGTTSGYSSEQACLDTLNDEESDPQDDPSLGERIDAAVFGTLAGVWNWLTGLAG